MPTLQPAESFFLALDQLAAIIDSRAQGEPAERPSYTRKLLSQGPRVCAKKLGEEAIEAALAVVAGDAAEVAEEAADLLYHLFVALASRGVPLSAIGAALERRQDQSGIDEKAGRAISG